MEKDRYSEEFWYSNLESHGDVKNYGEEYYANHLYDSLVKNIKDMPDNGYIVVLGTNRCVSFNLLIEIFGKERCIGIDIANPINHPLVRVKNVLDFTEEDDFPIAFAHNDIGSYPLTPIAKIKAQMWAAKNIVEGGYLLSRNNLNAAKFPSEEYMSSMGFLNTHLLSLKGFIDLSKIELSVLEGHMLSKKCKPEIWNKK